MEVQGEALASRGVIAMKPVMPLTLPNLNWFIKVAPLTKLLYLTLGAPA